MGCVSKVVQGTGEKRRVMRGKRIMRDKVRKKKWRQVDEGKR